MKLLFPDLPKLCWRPHHIPETELRIVQSGFLEREQDVRFWSTPQSTLAGEVTVLATLETVAATAFSVWLVVHRGTLNHVVLGACIAPFLLLRTDESTRLAIEWAIRLAGIMSRSIEGSPYKRILVISQGSLAAFALLFVRFAGIVFVAVQRPLYSLRAIPRNWTRVVLATDLHHPPEFLPEGETTLGAIESLEMFQFSIVWGFLRYELSKKPRREKAIAAVVFFFFIVVFFLPALIYRYSLKATAIIYLPLVWVLHDSKVEAETFRNKLEDISESQIERLKRWYSAFVIVFLVLVPAVVSLTLHEWWQGVSRWLQHAHPAIVALLSAFLPASPSGLRLEGWHVARGINAGLTLALFFWADGKLRQMQRGTSQNSHAAVAGLNFWLLSRGLLTLYIIGCTLYIVIRAVDWKGMLPVHIKWLP